MVLLVCSCIAEGDAGWRRSDFLAGVFAGVRSGYRFSAGLWGLATT